MCGIVYIKRKDKIPAHKSVLKRYRKQQHRGKEGFGYVAVKNDQVVSYKRAETEKEIIDLMSKETAEEILFHHRFPTSTPNITECAHPIQVDNISLKHQYFIAHNGVIKNDEMLKTVHEKLGFTYTTEIEKGYVTREGKHYVEGTKWNDSEALAIETALALEGRQEKIGTIGAAAVIALQVLNKTVVNRFFYRNLGNPLMYHEDKTMIEITTMGAGAFVSLEKVQKLKAGGIESLDISPPPFTEYSNYSGGYSGYHDYSKVIWDYHQQKYVPREEKPVILLPDKSLRSIGDILKDIESIPTEKSLNFYTDDSLSKEWEKSIEKEIELKQKLEEVEGSDVDMFFTVEKLQEKLKKVKDYQDILADEIMSREATQGAPLVYGN